jgi:5-methylcytosine-specific restriction endonuclease McrA
MPLVQVPKTLRCRKSWIFNYVLRKEQLSLQIHMKNTLPGPRHPRLRLDQTSYRGLWQQVLKRDGWRCQRCGSSKDLQVHHIQPRSLLGGHTEANLITICSVCHREAHLSATPLK